MIMTEKMEVEIENIENILADNELTDSEKIRILNTFTKIQKNPNSKDLGIFYRIKINMARYSLIIKQIHKLYIKWLTFILEC